MRKILLTALIVLTALSAYGQGGLPLKTGKKYVTATVEPGTGWVQVRQYPGNLLDGNYSHPKKSFISFEVNGKIYTNNDVGLGTLPPYVSVLTDGLLSKKKGQSVNTDTIICTWANKDGVDLIQELYPVLFDKSEQIVIRWKVNTKDKTNVLANAQFLLDIEVGPVGSDLNDGPDCLTNFGYIKESEYFPKFMKPSIPTFFQVFQYRLPNAPTFDPGLVGTGFLDSVYGIQLNLRKPDSVSLGNWNLFVSSLWGPPQPNPLGGYADGSILFSWPGIVCPLKNTMYEVGSMSYGVGEFGVCVGQVYVLTSYPHVKHYTSKPKPEEFDVETQLFSLSAFPINGVDVSLQVGEYLKITSPQPLLDSNRLQIQAVSNGGVIPPLGVSIAKWKVRIDTAKFPKDDFYSLLSFRATNSTHDPLFVMDTGTCDQLISFDLPEYDSLPPVFKQLSPIDSSIRRVSFSEIRALDSGLKSISWTFVTPADSSNFIITPQPIVGACMKGIDTVTIFQKDTTKGGCINFVAVDCAGNKTEITYCVVGKVFVPSDTISPVVVSRTTKDKLTKEIVVSDPTPNSSMMGTVLNQPIPTLPSFNQNILFNTNCTMFGGRITVQRIDSLQAGCVYYTISDCAGNTVVDSICFVADTSLGVTDKQDDNTFSILGNPSSGKATIQLILAKAQDATLRIVDALGREVRRVDVKGLAQGENLIPLQTSELASGTYYLIVEIDGKQFTKSLKVVR